VDEHADDVRGGGAARRRGRVNMNEIQSRVPYDTYRALEGVNMSRLKEIRRSPKHYKHALTAPDKETKPLRLGTAAHCAVLEPERYEQTYAVWGERTEGGRLRPRNGKDYDAFCRHHEGKTILTVDEHADAIAIQAAVRGDATAMALPRTRRPRGDDAGSARAARARVGSTGSRALRKGCRRSSG
jgi:hypothetical protein